MTEPTFYQDPYQAWHFCTVTDIYALPLGTKFQTINAPIPAVSLQWLRTLWRVGMTTDKRTGQAFRAYVQEYSQQYAECPVSDEFMVYVDSRRQAA